ncbi:MAG: transporter substrate-binding domain-containing protein, partial [Desulfuromonadales bacterium]|nr:transporter substrate-binding domain-containing protein [Desulfuromonadales bacterium]
MIFKRCHFKKLSRRTLSPFVRSALLFCALIFTFFWLSPAVVAAESSRIELTAEEQAWLAEHPVITLATGNGNYPPAEIKNPDGTWSGFNIEFFEQLSKLLDIDIRLHYGAWAETQKKAMNGELDGLSIVGKDPRRDVIFNATDTIYPSYFSVFSASRADLKINSFTDLDGLRIGYKRGARPAKTRLKKLPEATAVPFD